MLGKQVELASYLLETVLATVPTSSQNEGGYQGLPRNQDIEKVRQQGIEPWTRRLRAYKSLINSLRQHPHVQ